MEREREHKKGGDRDESKRGREEGKEEVGGEETFLLYLWFYLRKEGSLFGSNYVCFLTIVDKTSHGVYVTVV